MSGSLTSRVSGEEVSRGMCPAEVLEEDALAYFLRIIEKRESFEELAGEPGERGERGEVGSASEELREEAGGEEGLEDAGCVVTIDGTSPSKSSPRIISR